MVAVQGMGGYRQCTGLGVLDLRFVKDITRKGEGHHLDLFMDVFNLTAAPNLNFGPGAVPAHRPSSVPGSRRLRPQLHGRRPPRCAIHGATRGLLVGLRFRRKGRHQQ